MVHNSIFCLSNQSAPECICTGVYCIMQCFLYFFVVEFKGVEMYFACSQLWSLPTTLTSNSNSLQSVWFSTPYLKPNFMLYGFCKLEKPIKSRFYIPFICIYWMVNLIRYFINKIFYLCYETLDMTWRLNKWHSTHTRTHWYDPLIIHLFFSPFIMT